MKKVLIIDDNTFAIKVLSDILGKEYEILNARDGRQGINVAISHQPSLVLLDIEMPELNGFQVLKFLKENTLTESIPVIFLTGVMDPEAEEKGFLLGAVDYIVKPYNQNVVKVRVKTHIELAEYRKKIEMQLRYDCLTNIYNRRGIEEYFIGTWKKAVSEGLILTFIMLDIDYFKLINDTYGHLEGDRAIKKVAAILEASLPINKGNVARFGGEEFAVILYDITEKEAQQFIRQIFDTIRDKRIPNENSPVSKYMTISAGGITKVPTRNDDFEDFIEKADKMLYKCKAEGRNCYQWYDIDIQEKV